MTPTLRMSASFFPAALHEIDALSLASRSHANMDRHDGRCASKVRSSFGSVNANVSTASKR